MSLSPVAKKMLYEYGAVDTEDEVRDYLAGNRKYGELSFWAQDLLEDMQDKKTMINKI